MRFMFLKMFGHVYADAPKGGMYPGGGLGMPTKPRYWSALMLTGAEPPTPPSPATSCSKPNIRLLS
eukprot:CAMPEP_0177699282 /NCGR_PEP_ID=MMETSP0484_2-20121128/5501_1 /TAXON_ID=354590 /ORGANISM="Rhodomonas lens, Strain RHODO" /LENGTH=65 /DNA_ID=CAMNT_0019210451 /DNA_START=318 /DNA_END=512 /DNA_ORIENTATION=-